MEIRDFILKEKARGDCYRLLAACFYQPQQDIFIREELFKNLTASLKYVSPDASAIAGKMEKTFLNYSEEELLVAYAKLFIGPNELAAPPYGSVYLDGEKRVMGDSTMEVIRMYEEQGLAMDKEFRNLPDHITVELEFMYYLIFKEVEALEKSEFDTAHKFMETQELFLNGFLRKWIKPFCDKIRNSTDSEFYKALADCAVVFVENSHPGDDVPEKMRAKTARH